MIEISKTNISRDDLMSIAQVLEAYQVSRRTVYNLRKSGLIREVKLGNAMQSHVFLLREDVEKTLKFYKLPPRLKQKLSENGNAF